jgi:hypothetical protein
LSQTRCSSCHCRKVNGGVRRFFGVSSSVSFRDSRSAFFCPHPGGMEMPCSLQRAHAMAAARSSPGLWNCRGGSDGDRGAVAPSATECCVMSWRIATAAPACPESGQSTPTTTGGVPAVAATVTCTRRGHALHVRFRAADATSPHPDPGQRADQRTPPGRPPAHTASSSRRTARHTGPVMDRPRA